MPDEAAQGVEGARPPASTTTGQGATPDAEREAGARPAGDDDALRATGQVALERERAARREAEQRAKEHERRIAELEDRDKTEVERARASAERERKRAEDAEARIAALELSALRREVASELGLPARLAERLRGDTERELRADARRLLDDLGERATGDVGVGKGGSATRASAKTDMNDWIRGGSRSRGAA
jgi:hypothetical protein